jgi:hypothetical protein
MTTCGIPLVVLLLALLGLLTVAGGATLLIYCAIRAIGGQDDD